MGDFLFFFQISKFRFSPAYLALLTAEWRNIRLKSSGVIVSNREDIESKKFFAGCKFVMHRRSSRFIPRATLLAGIASIYPIAHSIGYERSYIPLVLDGLTRDAQTGITLPRSAQRTGGTTVYTTRTIAASSNDRTIGGRSKEVINSPKKKKEPLPGIINWAFFPIKPRPARTAQ